MILCIIIVLIVVTLIVRDELQRIGCKKEFERKISEIPSKVIKEWFDKHK